MEIEALSKEELSRLRRWFVEQDWDHWEQQLEADVDVILQAPEPAKHK